MKMTKRPARNVSLSTGDLPDDAVAEAYAHGTIAWDIETTGLDWKSDQIGTCQMHVPGTGNVYIVQTRESRPANIKTVTESDEVRKIFHHAMFDLRFMTHAWSLEASNVACTKIASKILSPDADSHSLQYLLDKYLGVKILKDQQKSDWLSGRLSAEQIAYASDDVAHLTELIDELAVRLKEVGLSEITADCFDFIPTRVELDLRESGDVFTY